MAISKLILNGEVQMDVTSDTVMASSLLSGKTATKNDGTKITGNIASKSSDDLTASGATVTAPAGYYANAASKAVATTTHPNPSASITSSTGVVTASHTQGTGYVTGGTTTGTLNLTTQAGKTVTPTESAQTAVASYRWTTGNINVAAISSTYVGTGVTTRSSTDLTASGSVVTAPAGYYSTAATKSIAAGSAFPPAVTITKAPTIGVNTSGVVTASYNGSSSITPTVTSGYVSKGTAGTISTTGTSTYQLTSKAAATYYPSTADQTIASQRWLVGNQTIKSVTTSNLTAANIAEGVVVKVGDSSNASRITQVTGTHSGGVSHTLTITGSGSSNFYVMYKGVKYSSSSSISFSTGDSLTLYVGATSDIVAKIVINGQVIHDTYTTYNTSYILPNCDVTIDLNYNSSSAVRTLTLTTPNINITRDGIYDVISYGMANVNVGGYKVDQIAACSISGAITVNVNVNAYAFYGQPITEAKFYNNIIYDNAFRQCTSLITASGNCLIIGSSAFMNCYKLTNISFPVCTEINTYAFFNCSSITTASFPRCSYISPYAFESCFRLLSLYLLGSSIPFCGAGAFSSTPISNYTGYTDGEYGKIYVPSSLYGSYLTATNWSKYSSRFVSV